MSKVVWIINQYATTVETGLGGRHFYLSRELAKKGYKVYLIGSSSSHLLRVNPIVTSRFSAESIDGFTFVWVEMPKYSGARSPIRILNWFLFPFRLQKLPSFVQEKPDVILCSSPPPFAFLGAQRLARKFGAKLIFEVRDIWPLTLMQLGGYSPRNPLIRMMQWVEDRAYREAEVVVSNLKGDVEHMVDRGLRPDKFRWVPNGFSKGEVDTCASVDAAYFASIPQDKFIVGYAGTFGLANSLHTLIDAAEILKENSDVVFVFVGGGIDQQRLIDSAKAKGLSNIYFLDFVQKQAIHSVLAKFDVLTVGAQKSPLYRFGVSPNKLFDYMAAGKPVIYHIDSGKYRPAAEHGFGLQVEPENPAALAEAVLSLFNMTEEQRRVLGENGRKAGLEFYEYEALASKLETAMFDQESA